MALEALVEPCPIPPALSTTTTLRPARASSSAIAAPITPAPTTTASAVLVTPTPYGAGRSDGHSGADTASTRSITNWPTAKGIAMLEPTTIRRS